MKVNVYAVYDVKAKCYASPFFLPEDAQAVRAFGDLVCREDSKIHAHPKDYDLFRLSTFDDCAGIFGVLNEDGEIVPDISPPVFLAHASSFMPPDVSVN